MLTRAARLDYNEKKIVLLLSIIGGIYLINKVLVETSARHLHVTEEDLATLFGPGATLTHKKDLSQPGQYACEERVDLVGPKNTLKNVIILGPCRKATQVEVSLTDARTLGCEAPVRESGDIAGSGSIKLVGPKGEVELKEGVIAAKRHIHMTPEDAAAMGLEDKQIVSVKVESAARSLTFGDVVLRVSSSFATAMHIDTDEANAAGLSGEVYGEIIK
jgi:putative phosphotransacetylase